MAQKTGDQVPSSSDSEDFGPSLSNRLAALTDSIISSTTNESSSIQPVESAITANEGLKASLEQLPGAAQQTTPKSVPTLSSGPDNHPKIDSQSKNSPTDSLRESSPSQKNSSVEHNQHLSNPRLGPLGRVTSAARLPREFLQGITRIQPNRADFSGIRKRVERNIS